MKNDLHDMKRILGFWSIEEQVGDNLCRAQIISDQNYSSNTFKTNFKSAVAWTETETSKNWPNVAKKQREKN